MREGAKKRLIGAVVVVTLAVIFVPMLFEPESLNTLPPIQESIPRAPAFKPDLKTETFIEPRDSAPVGSVGKDSTVSQPLALPPPVGSDPGRGRATATQGSALGYPPAAVPEPAQAPKPEALAKTTEPATPRGGRDGMPSWVIQVASVPTPEGAAELEGKLKAGGFPAFVERAEVNGKVYYRVRVGPESDRARAEQTAARLRERHKVNTLITSYP